MDSNLICVTSEQNLFFLSSNVETKEDLIPVIS